MPRPKQTAKPSPTVPVVPTPMTHADAGSALYRDRAGAPRGVPLSEGRDNFAAITNGARALLEHRKA